MTAAAPLLLLLALAATENPAVPARGTSPRYADWPALRDRAAARPDADLVLVGDSIAEGWPEALLAPHGVLNLGVGRDRTQNMLWRLDRYDLRPIRPRIVVLVAGTNNLGGTAPETTAAGLLAVIGRLRTIWPAARLIVIAVPPRGVALQAFARKRAVINATLRTEAARHGYTLFDPAPILACPAPQPGCATYRPDLLHLSVAGYAALTRALRPLLEAPQTVRTSFNWLLGRDKDSATRRPLPGADR